MSNAPLLTLQWNTRSDSYRRSPLKRESDPLSIAWATGAARRPRLGEILPQPDQASLSAHGCAAAYGVSRRAVLMTETNPPHPGRDHRTPAFGLPSERSSAPSADHVIRRFRAAPTAANPVQQQHTAASTTVAPGQQPLTCPNLRLHYQGLGPMWGPDASRANSNASRALMPEVNAWPKADGLRGGSCAYRTAVAPPPDPAVFGGHRSGVTQGKPSTGHAPFPAAAVHGSSGFPTPSSSHGDAMPQANIPPCNRQHPRSSIATPALIRTDHSSRPERVKKEREFELLPPETSSEAAFSSPRGGTTRHGTHLLLRAARYVNRASPLVRESSPGAVERVADQVPGDPAVTLAASSSPLAAVAALPLRRTPPVTASTATAAAMFGSLRRALEVDGPPPCPSQSNVKKSQRPPKTRKEALGGETAPCDDKPKLPASSAAAVVPAKVREGSVPAPNPPRRNRLPATGRALAAPPVAPPGEPRSTSVDPTDKPTAETAPDPRRAAPEKVVEPLVESRARRPVPAIRGQSKTAPDDEEARPPEGDLRRGRPPAAERSTSDVSVAKAASTAKAPAKVAVAPPRPPSVARRRDDRTPRASTNVPQGGTNAPLAVPPSARTEERVQTAAPAAAAAPRPPTQVVAPFRKRVSRSRTPPPKADPRPATTSALPHYATHAIASPSAKVQVPMASSISPREAARGEASVSQAGGETFRTSRSRAGTLTLVDPSSDKAATCSTGHGGQPGQTPGHPGQPGYPGPPGPAAPPTDSGGVVARLTSRSSNRAAPDAARLQFPTAKESKSPTGQAPKRRLSQVLRKSATAGDPSAALPVGGPLKKASGGKTTSRISQLGARGLFPSSETAATTASESNSCTTNATAATAGSARPRAGAPVAPTTPSAELMSSDDECGETEVTSIAGSPRIPEGPSLRLCAALLSSSAEIHSGRRRW